LPPQSGWREWIVWDPRFGVEGDVIRWREPATDSRTGEKTALVEIAAQQAGDAWHGDRRLYRVQEYFVWRGKVIEDERLDPDKETYITRAWQDISLGGVMRMLWRDEAARPAARLSVED
jgi:hypothetical protein